MQFSLADLPRLLPEIMLAVLAMLVLLSDALERWGSDAAAVAERHRAAWQLAAVGLALVLGIVVVQSRLFFTVPEPLPPGGLNTVLNLFIGAGRNLQSAPADVTPVLGAFATDHLAMIARLTLIAAALLTVLLAADLLPKEQPGEVFALLLTATAGMCLMAGATDLILAYIGVELASISLYVLVGYLRADGRSAEAGLKYYLFGAVSSGLLLYGMSLTFGLTVAAGGGERGATLFATIGAALGQTAEPQLLLLAVLLLVAGLGYKIAAVPFHAWAPDVYQGAPTVIAGFLSTASKLAGFVLLYRLLTEVFPGAAGRAAALGGGWAALLALIAAATLLFGNLAALPQTSVKRLLAYSSIAQAGFVLLALLVWGGGNPTDQAFGAAALLFYLVAYTFTNLAAFGALAASGAQQLDDLRGLWRRSPALTLALTLPVLSLAGIPPLAGFWGKLFVFMAAYRSGAVWLLAVAVVLTVVALGYYLKLLRVAWFPTAEVGPPIVLGGAARAALAVAVLLVVLFGVLPGVLWGIVAR